MNSSPASSARSVFERGLGLSEHFGGWHCPTRELQELFHEALHLAFRLGTLEQIGDLTLPEGGDGWDGLHRQPHPGQLLDQGAVFVDVDLDQFDPAAGRA